MKTKFNKMNEIKIVFVMALITLLSFNVNAQENQNDETKIINFKPTIKINGRIQYDYEFLNRAEEDEGLNENEFRRVHFSATGNVAKRLKYKIETDFAHGQLGFRDVYLKYTTDKIGNFIVGSYTEPTSLNMVTSSKYISFNERAMLISLQNFRWGSGLHYENFGLFDGKITFQMALTNNGLNDEGFVDHSLEDGMNFVARTTTTILKDKEKNQIVHLGLNYDSRPYKDLKFRPENHLGDKYQYVFIDGEHRNSIGVELASTFGPLSIQGEFKSQNIDAPNKSYIMQSYYAYASYFITGEHRPYKHASFGRVKPKKDIDNNGFGAVEVLARYSNMNASKDVVDDNLGLPEDINNISLGLNWYLNAHARLMYNYVITDDGNDTLGNLNQHLLRVQIDF